MIWGPFSLISTPGRDSLSGLEGVLCFGFGGVRRQRPQEATVPSFLCTIFSNIWPRYNYCKKVVAVNKSAAIAAFAARLSSRLVCIHGCGPPPGAKSINFCSNPAGFVSRDQVFCSRSIPEDEVNGTKIQGTTGQRLAWRTTASECSPGSWLP